ncbi:MAG: hypothetical protein WCC58_11810 [Burkholderiales bacterium]
MKTILMAVVAILVIGLTVVTLSVESEAKYQLEVLESHGNAKALILFHPSRDAHFSDELSLAIADGLKTAGFSVQRATVTRSTPGAPKEFALIAVVSNTYWWTPDLPTLRYLARARLDNIPAVGIIGGAGATKRSQRMLDEALRKTGANVIQTRAFWLFRPNDEARMNEPNRQVALQMAMQFGASAGKNALAPGKQR